MNPQLEGVEKLSGTYPFDIAASVRCYRINRFLWRMTIPEHREAFMKDPEALYEKFGLSEEERDLLRRRDWRGLIRYGTNFFVMEKLARIDRITNGDVYAAMRGETLEEFLKTRNVPGAR